MISLTNTSPLYRSTAPSTLPSYLPPFPPASLSSLPTELLTRIVDYFPHHPAHERTCSLARVCLVNKFFLSIAQPLLFRNIHLNLDQDYDADFSRYRKLVQILTSGHPISKEVKDLRVSFERGGTNSIDMAVFAFVLSSIGPLESIRTSWWHDRGFDYAAEFIQAILQYQKGLKRLEIPKVHYIDSTAFSSIFTALPNLEVFIGHFPSPPNQAGPITPICHLRRLVITTPFDPPLFQQITEQSHTSLTSLAIWLTTSHDPLDFSSYTHLSLLRINISHSSQWKIRLLPVSDPLLEDLKDFFSKTLPQTLLSLRNLPIQTLSISAQSAELQLALKFCSFLDALPPSIVHFTAIPQVFSQYRLGSNQLLEQIRGRSYPRLKLISILPEDYWGPETSEHGTLQQEAAYDELMESCAELGVRVETVGGQRPEPHPRMALDLHEADSETEVSDGEAVDEFAIFESEDDSEET